MKKNIINYFLCGVLIATSACTKTAEKIDMAIGNWKGVLYTEDNTAIPFNFSVMKDSSTYRWVISNADDRLEVDEINIQGDSVFLRMPFYDSEFRFKNLGNSLEGVWIKHLADRDVSMKFHAVAGIDERFDNSNSSASANLEGRWEAIFLKPNGDSLPAIAELVQEGNRVTGSILTTTGDYRFLEGVLDGNQLMLSAFDGSYALLFTAELNEENHLVNGMYYSGYNQVRSWTAKRNKLAELADANALTYLKEGYTEFYFSFPDLNNQTVSLSDDRFKEKVVVVQLLGSWCPNCIDETAYLAPYYDQMKGEGLEIVGLAYERKDDFKKAQENLGRLINRLNVHYTILFAGANTSENLSATLPMLNRVMAFPTKLIIDRKGNLRKIHTGFSGPATGVHFANYKKEFETFIDKLLKE